MGASHNLTNRTHTIVLVLFEGTYGWECPKRSSFPSTWCHNSTHHQTPCWFLSFPFRCARKYSNRIPSPWRSLLERRPLKKKVATQNNQYVRPWPSIPHNSFSLLEHSDAHRSSSETWYSHISAPLFHGLLRLPPDNLDQVGKFHHEILKLFHEDHCLLNRYILRPLFH